MVKRRARLGVAGVAVATSLLGSGVARADATIAIRPTADYGVWEGWGTSLAWWANVFGDRDDFADILFTTGSVAYGGITLPGLGLNVVRYNLGASSSAWNWNADARQRAALVKATQRGAMSELFANSPSWWMCLNHNPSGAADGGNNLQPWNYAQHAYHLAVTARNARDRWGVSFRTVDPFNEPSATWWRATGGQEGCHVDASVQRTVLAHLRSELDRQGLTGVAVSASDETSYDQARTTWNGFDAATKAVVRQVNVHGYQGAGGRRDLLYNDVRAAGKVLWNSETGENDSTGVTMARNLCLDWRWLHPTAWCYWQVMDPGPGWAAIHYDFDTLVPGAVQPKYYVLAQFTRHIRPGMRIIDTGVGYAAAAYDPVARRLVIVAVNTGVAQTLTFDLSSFSQVTGGSGGLVPRWSTVPAGTDRYTQRLDARLSGKSVSVPFPAASVQTLQVDGVAV